MPRKKTTITPFEKQKICANGISCGFTCIGSKRSCKTSLAGKALETAQHFKGLIFQYDPELRKIITTIGDDPFNSKQ